MGIGLAVVKWPLLLDRGSWTLEEGTIEALLVAMSLLALLGVRYPVRMLPILLFEVTWKLIWLGVVALPLWTDYTLRGRHSHAGWRGLVGGHHHRRDSVASRVAQYVTAPADPWRRSR